MILVDRGILGFKNQETFKAVKLPQLLPRKQFFLAGYFDGEIIP